MRGSLDGQVYRGRRNLGGGRHRGNLGDEGAARPLTGAARAGSVVLAERVGGGRMAACRGVW
jgi:hypothetical protein